MAAVITDATSLFSGALSAVGAVEISTGVTLLYIVGVAFVASVMIVLFLKLRYGLF